MAFLHGDVNEDIYMSPPAGFTAMGEQDHLVCKIEKSLYVLKQAPQIWYQKFATYIRNLGYSLLDSNPCMYIQQLSNESQITPDPVFRRYGYCTRSDQVEIRRLKRSLHDKFAMKELGQARQILVMRIEQNQMTKTLQLSQSDYILKVLKKLTCRTQNRHRLRFQHQHD